MSCGRPRKELWWADKELLVCVTINAPMQKLSLGVVPLFTSPVTTVRARMLIGSRLSLFHTRYPLQKEEDSSSLPIKPLAYTLNGFTVF